MAHKIIKRKKKKQQVSPNTLAKPVYQGDKYIDTDIELVSFDSLQVIVKNLNAATKLKPEIDNSKINWFRVTGIADADRISAICYEFGLHGFDIKDLLSDQQVVKVVNYDNICFVLMPAFYLNKDNDLEDVQIGLLLGENFIVSFQETAISVFDDIKIAIEENNTTLRHCTSDFLLYILMRSVNTMNITSIMDMQDQLDDLEDRLLVQQEPADTVQILRKRRIDYTHIKRFIISLREEYNNLLHSSNKLIKTENLVYFNDYDDKLRTTLSNLETFHESLLSLLDIYYNNNNLKMNSIMKQLTIVSTIFIPLTFLVGVWGMNFKFMPELLLPYGYYISWGIFIVVALIIFFWLKRKKWF